jgi:hypothetical protein
VSGRHRVAAGDVILLDSNTLCSSEPLGPMTATTVCLVRDYVTDQVFWEHSTVLSGRTEAVVLDVRDDGVRTHEQLVRDLVCSEVSVDESGNLKFAV